MSVSFIIQVGANEALDGAAQVQGKRNAAAERAWPAAHTPGACARTHTSVHC